uniref:Uncharacterized protein n=1 Tax=Spironucleus salmonicida TaxID=348837 RepID=V6LMN4_9EUKA|eukprot:EST45890.1 Hypothetical protein SS50377_14181 [Spironucleus salmonicida]
MIRALIFKIFGSLLLRGEQSSHQPQENNSSGIARTLSNRYYAQVVAQCRQKYILPSKYGTPII